MGRASSGEVEKCDVAAGWGSDFEQGFDAAHAFACRQDIAANVADLGVAADPVLSEYATFE
jgi:hypothetical protein